MDLGKIKAEAKGENGYQTPAEVFSSETKDPLAVDLFKVIEGTPLSYNNFCDVDRLLQTITHIAAAYAVNFNKVPFIAIGGKHGNPCGASVGDNQTEVLSKMMAGDPLAIFGGLVMTNFNIDEVLAEQLAGKMLDGVIAPGFTPEAIAKMRRKGDKCRFLVNVALKDIDEKSLDTANRFRYIRGGFLSQPNYTFVMNFKDGVTKHTQATENQEKDLLLAWAIGATSNSNTITLVNESQLIGNGVGQQDRVGAANLAIARAIRSSHSVEGSVAYSDSFFPFSDGPQALINSGVKAILSSSGSVRDGDTINLCAEKEVALYMIPDSVGRGFFGH